MGTPGTMMDDLLFLKQNLNSGLISNSNSSGISKNVDFGGRFVNDSDIFEGFSVDQLPDQHLVDQISKIPESLAQKPSDHQHLVDNRVSFAQVVANNKGFEDSILFPELSIDGISAKIVVPDAFYDACLGKAEDLDLIGRLVLSKGAKPILINDLRAKLRDIWNLKADWKLTPLGRSFFYIRFSSKDDKVKVWSRGHVSLGSISFKLQKWTPNFDPLNIKNSNADVWVRIFGLGGEIFSKDVIFNIARAIGSPIRLDNSSEHFHLGIFARILVDVDFSSNLLETITLSLKDVDHLLKVEYEAKPTFCHFCSCLGHIEANCRRKNTSEDRGRPIQKKNFRHRSVSRKPIHKSVSRPDLKSNKGAGISNLSSKDDLGNLVDAAVAKKNLNGFALVSAKRGKLINPTVDPPLTKVSNRFEVLDGQDPVNVVDNSSLLDSLNKIRDTKVTNEVVLSEPISKPKSPISNSLEKLRDPKVTKEVVLSEPISKLKSPISKINICSDSLLVKNKDNVNIHESVSIDKVLSLSPALSNNLDKSVDLSKVKDNVTNNFLDQSEDDDLTFSNLEPGEITPDFSTQGRLWKKKKSDKNVVISDDNIEIGHKAAFPKGKSGKRKPKLKEHHDSSEYLIEDCKSYNLRHKN